MDGWRSRWVLLTASSLVPLQTSGIVPAETCRAEFWMDSPPPVLTDQTLPQHSSACEARGATGARIPSMQSRSRTALPHCRKLKQLKGRIIFIWHETESRFYHSDSHLNADTEKYLIKVFQIHFLKWLTEEYRLFVQGTHIFTVIYV